MIERTLGKYNDFVCAAGECKKTCCSGWAVEIDEDTLELYKAEKIKGIDYKNSCFMQKENGDCIFLNKDKLCDLYLEHGDGIFCKTCDMYPRHIEEFPNVREYSLSISCPLVAKDFLLDREGHVIKISENENKVVDFDEYDDFNDVLYEKLLELREIIFEIIKDKGRNFDEKCSRIIFLARMVQDMIDEGNLLECLDSLCLNGEFSSDKFNDIYDKSQYKIKSGECFNLLSFSEIKQVLQELEPLDEDFISEVLDMDDICDEDIIEFMGSTFRENGASYEDSDFPKDFSINEALNKILFYFIYTYLCGAAYDEYVYGMAAVAVFSTMTIRDILINKGDISIDEMAEVIYLYSRELEHSNENMILLEEILDEL